MTYSKALSGANPVGARDNAAAHSSPRSPGSQKNEHWLAPDLVHRSALSAPPVELSPYVIDLEGEIGFWHLHYRRSAVRHRNILPFLDYVPAFKLGVSLFLQCHGHTLEALSDGTLGATYERVRRDSRVEWTEARHAVHASFLRLQARWDEAALARIRHQEPAHRETARPIGDLRHLRTLRRADRSAESTTPP